MSEEKKTELLSCPFCGSEPEMILTGNEHTPKRSATIKCPDCRIQRTDSVITLSMDAAIAFAIKKWNTRATTQTPSRQAAFKEG